jgi:hypothetical protein
MNSGKLCCVVSTDTASQGENLEILNNTGTRMSCFSSNTENGSILHNM